MIAFGECWVFRLLFVIAAFAGLAACATPRGAIESSNPHYKVGAPYKIGGRWYYPKEEPDYNAVGVASWYGDAFQGKPTANGEIFDKARLSAAHKTLPLPSIVQVQNLENGKSVLLRVNDRGPFVDDRLIDVSHAAASELGFEQNGLARVRVSYLGRADLYAKAEPARGGRAPKSEIKTARATPAPAAIPPVQAAAQPEESDAMAQLIGDALLAPPAPPEIWIAVSDFSDLNALETARIAVSGLGESRIVTTPTGGGAFLYQLQVGPDFDPLAADARLAALREAGYLDARIAPNSL